MLGLAVIGWAGLRGIGLAHATFKLRTRKCPSHSLAKSYVGFFNIAHDMMSVLMCATDLFSNARTRGRNRSQARRPHTRDNQGGRRPSGQREQSQNQTVLVRVSGASFCFRWVGACFCLMCSIDFMFTVGGVYDVVLYEHVKCDCDSLRVSFVWLDAVVAGGWATRRNY